jgi:predicted RND superfamily exporter protein
LATRVTPDNRTTKVVVLLKEDSTEFGKQIIRRAERIAREELPPGYRLKIAGTLASNAALTDVMVRGKILSMLQIAAITIVVASLLFRSWICGLLVSVPLAFAVVIDIGVMGLFRLPLDISAAIVLGMAVGVGADYAVYFLSRIREEYDVRDPFASILARAMVTSGEATIFVSTAVAAGYSVLCISRFRIFVQLGSLVGLAMITASLATLVAIPALVTILSQTRFAGAIIGPASTSPRSTSSGPPKAAANATR